MAKVPFPPAPGKGPARHLVTCVRLVCDVFLSVELVGSYPSEAAAALHAGVGWPCGVEGGDDGALYRTPVGDCGDRYVYDLVAVPACG